MIPGLLHQRLLNVGVADPPSYNGFTIISIDQAFGSGPAEATGRFIVRPDGTWSGEDNEGTEGSGNWYSPTTGGIGAGYEVKFTVTQIVGSGTGITITNPAPDFVSLATLKTVSIKNSRATNGAREDRFEVLAEIRLAGGAVVCTGTVEIRLIAELNT